MATGDYTTLDEYKRSAVPNATDNGADDSVIESIITAASRTIDTFTGRTFYSRTETHYYDLPRGNKGDLFIYDDDLLTVTSITNGDATTIAAANYQLLPLNSSPKYAIHLKSMQGYYWAESTTTGEVGCITVAGTWGYAATAPADIEQACIAIARAEYQRRFGQNNTFTSEESSTILPSGMVIAAGGIPKSAWQILQNYRRRV